MLDEILSYLGRKRFFEGYTVLSAGTYTDINIEPPVGRVYIILSIDVSMENRGFVALYFGDRRDSWMPAYKIIERYSGDNTVSISGLNVIVTESDRFKLRVSNGSTTSSSTTYVNYEYLDVSKDEFEKIKEKLSEEYRVV